MLYIDVIGAGSIGSSLVTMLIEYFKASCNIRVYDNNINNLRDIEDANNIEKIPKYELNGNTNIVICCSSWPSTKEVLLYLYNNQFKGYFFSISRDTNNEIFSLKALLEASQIKAIMPLGLEPGLLDVLVDTQIAKLGHIDSIITYCGGIVTKRPKNPLGYKRLFGKTNLPFNFKEAYKISSGQLVKIPRFSEVLPYYWDSIGMLESFHDGMHPHVNLNIKLTNANVEQRTLRWPGYASGVRLLNQLSLMDDNKENGISKKELMEQLLEKIFTKADKEKTKTLLAIHTKYVASENVLKIEFGDHSETTNSMALATCLPIIFVVSALDNLNIKNGINHPNNLFTKKYVDQMLNFITKFNVTVKEQTIIS